ncbi:MULTISPECIES: PQQ-dependent sugar dehydrogenase [Arenibacter]|uniref:PQQ-dependent sugar dehydrogenase n=1 Tax=Arenibacter TaxID=178469 RepID=UPI00069229B0|nr:MULTISPECIES: PQQ-dependent sugar dehydrogenase [Arenibacter]GBF17987.1 glucose / Sorbosone dehydrogenase [Arenibacter sp. NBRC 103722]
MSIFSSKTFLFIKYLGYMLMVLLLLASCKENGKNGDKSSNLIISPDNAGLTVPKGFKVIKVADSIGKPRHIAVGANGGIYVKLRQPINGKGILYLEDNNGDGIVDTEEGFGDYGGTGIYLDNNFLYASSDEAVFRYPINSAGKVSNTTPDTLITNLIAGRTHATKSITLDGAGNIYVNIGAYSNACQEQDRTIGSPAMMPCKILDSAGGIWRFRADKFNQSYGEGLRFATGLRNVMGLDWNKEINKLFVAQHGRDMLNTLFPDLYDSKTSAELPAETMYMLEEGDDAGWPYIYYDHLQKKKILAPEYGGDGTKTGGENALDPVAAFPAHLAPNALLFYTGDMFPPKYKNGAFIAFHGSWNRAPEKQAGYMVAFVPFENGKPNGDWEVFADGFAGQDEIFAPDSANHRPTGLAQGPDGSLYVSDDQGGTLFRIIYNDN